MTPRPLIRHSQSDCAAVTGITGYAVRDGGTLRLRFDVSGNIGDIKIPAHIGTERADALWQHTCFEAFVRPGPGPAYHEFNFSPSCNWAAYGFADYRQSMTELDIDPPKIDTRTSAVAYALHAAVDGLPDGVDWDIGLSAVIECVDGTLSYWALKHPFGPADFHHSDCFALKLGASGRA
jgi:hypothetical protein